MKRNAERAGAHRRPVYFAMVACAMVLASCYSSNYRREMLASVSLLSGLSDKLADYCRADFIVEGHPLSSEEMGEFYYGLQKARAYQRMTTARHGGEASEEAFAKLIDAYEKFVRDADQYRIAQGHTKEQLEQLLKEHDLVNERAQEVRRALGS